MAINVDRIRGQTGGLPLKAPCRAATTANITLYGEQTIDGIALVEGDRCFVRLQTATAENGIYNVMRGAWVRATDFNNGYEITYGTQIFVQYGTTLHDTWFSVTATANPVVVDTTSITTVQATSIEAAVEAGISTYANKVDAEAAAASAASSQSTASSAASAAGVSAAAALASENAAGVSETNSGASETAAGLSEIAAAASEVAAGLSETNSAASAAAALASQLAAEAAEAGTIDAAAQAAAAEASATAAAASETAAATSAGEAADYASQALDSALWRVIYGLDNTDTPYTPLVADAGALYSVDTTTAAVVINMLQISTITTFPYTAGIKKKAGSNTLTVNTTGTDTFDNGTTTCTLDSVGDTIHLVADDSTTPKVWYRIVLGSTAPAGSGDVSSDTASSIDNELVLFKNTSGKLVKRSTSTGIPKLTSGVLSVATEGTDYSGGTSALATGILKSTTTTGALSIATEGTEYSGGTSALATGILKSTTTTGALTIAVAGDFPTLNQNTTGTAADLSATLSAAKGGTGIANNAASTITISGNYASQFTFQGAYTYTYPPGTVTLASLTGTETLTNKRVNPRVISATSYTTDTGTSLNIDNCDAFVVTAQAGALLFNNPTGTPVDEQGLLIAVTGTAARALTWGTAYESSTIDLPTTTVTTARLNIALVYRSDTSKWVCVGVS